MGSIHEDGDQRPNHPKQNMDRHQGTGVSRMARCSNLHSPTRQHKCHIQASRMAPQIRGTPLLNNTGMRLPFPSRWPTSIVWALSWWALRHYICIGNSARSSHNIHGQDGQTHGAYLFQGGMGARQGKPHQGPER